MLQPKEARMLKKTKYIGVALLTMATTSAFANPRNINDLADNVNNSLGVIQQVLLNIGILGGLCCMLYGVLRLWQYSKIESRGSMTLTSALVPLGIGATLGSLGIVYAVFSNSFWGEDQNGSSGRVSVNIGSNR